MTFCIRDDFDLSSSCKDISEYHGQGGRTSRTSELRQTILLNHYLHVLTCPRYVLIGNCISIHLINYFISLVLVLRSKMNLTLYSIQSFIILDTEGNRVLAKYYKPKGTPQGESKEFATLKEQKAFEKGLWQKTKKSGGALLILIADPPSC